MTRVWGHGIPLLVVPVVLLLVAVGLFAAMAAGPPRWAARRNAGRVGP